MAEETKGKIKEGNGPIKRVLRFIPGILSIIFGIVMLTTKTPPVTTRFGADFYTESYQAIADVALILKYGFGFLLIAFGVRWLCSALSTTDAKSSTEQAPKPKADDQLPSV